MQEQLSLDEIAARSWSLHRPNGDCRSPLILLQPGGKLVGYEHSNEAAWMPYSGGFAFVSRDGMVTSVTAEIRRNDSGALQIRMVNPGLRDRTAHLLVEVGKAPADSHHDAAAAALARPSVSPALMTPAAAAPPANFNIEICVPDAATAFLEPEISRVFLIANNKDIAVRVFESLNLGANDIVVQYNKALFFATLAGYSCHKLHFFSPHIRSCWGFTDEARPELDYDAQQCCSLTFAVAHWIPSSVRPYFEGLNGRARHMAIVPDRHIALYCYPAGKSPSAGFMAVGFFRSLNWIRRQRGCRPLEISMLGFTGVYAPGKAWQGHDFAFEQKVYDTWLDLRRLNIDGSLHGGAAPQLEFHSPPAYCAGS
jgi:hypothetical protein